MAVTRTLWSALATGSSVSKVSGWVEGEVSVGMGRCCITSDAERELC